MEAWSVEDQGAGICFCVYAYNVQPGIVINYLNGDSYLDETTPTEEIAISTYWLNTSSKRFHTADCGQGQGIKEENRQVFAGERDHLLEQGYTPAGCCDP